jgi:hypothetical protein
MRPQRWVRAAGGLAALAAAVSVAFEPNLLGVIKVSMVAVFGLLGAALLVDASTARQGRPGQRGE